MLRFVFVVGMVCASVVNANEVEQVWAYEAPAGYVDASPALGDLDGDGKMDIVVGTTAGIIAAITSDAKEIWHQEMRGPICVAPSIGDIASSSGLEVLAMNQQGEIVCFAGSSGDLLWTATLPNKLYWGETTLALGDVTGDGNLEIVTGDGSGTVICLNGDGETLWLYKGDHGMTLSPVIVDLTGDGVQSILVGGDKIPLVCLSAAGKELWRSESGIGSSSLVYDLDGDSVPEILVGVDENFTVRDNTGKILWTYVMQREMDSAITVADADANGEVEIYVVDLAGTLVCLSPEGQLRWSADVVDRVRRSPSVGDVNGDGIQEILVVGYSNFLYAFDPDGGLKASIPISGGVNSTATLIPMADGVPGVILPVSNGIMSLFRWSEAQPDVSLLWPEYRFSARRSGNPQASAMSPPVEIELDVDTMYAGANFLKAAIQNPEGRLVEVRLESVRNAGVPFVVSITSSEKFIEHQLSYTVPSNQAINLTLSCTVLENNRILAKRNHTAYLPPFMKELGDASRAAAETEALLPRLLDKLGLEERCYFLKGDLAQLELRILAAGALTDKERVDLRNTVQTFLGKIQRLRDLAYAAAQAAEAGNTVFLCVANPWAPFGGLDEIKEGRTEKKDLSIEAFAGETESAALNVYNFSNCSRTFRVEPESLTCDDLTIPANTVMTLHEVVATPTEMREFSADAIPTLNSGNLIQVPAWGARQLWFNVNTDALTPGTWHSRIQLRSLDIDPVSAEAAMDITVWTAQLPEEQAVSLCHWGYVHSSLLKGFSEEALADQVRNGTNVFVGLFYPLAQYDEQGDLIGEIDFTDHDAYVKQHSPHGIILFCGYQNALKGPKGTASDAYAKAHVKWLRAWVAHLKKLGVGYDGFALYPVDEPGLSEGLVERYLLMAKLARKADPGIQMYTDPVGRITEEEIREMLPYVDIWCPNGSGLMIEENNAAKLDIIKKSGSTVWMYQCDGNVKHQSSLGYYRAQAWLAWHNDMTGIGFWSYCTSGDDPWFRPALRHDYLMVYPGNGVVSSKRWEAVRDGIEDYTLLAKMRDIVADPPANASPVDLEAARVLLEEDAYVIAQFCGLDDDGTLPGSEGLPGMRRVADERWKKIQATRRSISVLLSRIDGSK